MSTVKSVIIVGGSAAGISCIRQLRQGDFTGRIILIDKDKYGAYERPPLSKQALINPLLQSEDIALISAQELEALKVESYFGTRATSVLPAVRKVILDSGQEFIADVIVLATGGEARRLNITGANLPQVLVLRHFQDAINLRNRIQAKARVAVIGGGFIGAETAASLVKLDAAVHWLDAVELPLSHILPNELCQKIVAHHCADGIKLISNCRISKFVEQTDGSISIVFSDNSAPLNVDSIVMGVGMAPETPYFSPGVCEKIVSKTRGGIEVNQGQETEYLGVYAAGDVAAVVNTEGLVTRHEHWQSAQYQGEKAAASIMNKPLPEEIVDWFWSDQGDLHIEMAGEILSDQQYSVVRHEAEWPIYFSVMNNRVVGAVSVNNPNAVRAAMRMIKNKVNITPAKLVDTDLPLRKLMRG